MAISDKLNYLIETKQLFKDRLNSLGAEITNSTTFRNYLTWLDTFYGEVSDKTDISQNGVVGRTSQESTTGKNYFKASSSNYPQGLTITNNTTTGEITFSGTTTGSFPTLSNFTDANVPAGEYTFSIDKTLPYNITLRFRNASGKYPTFITIPSGSLYNTITTSYDAVRLEIVYHINSSGITVPTTTIKPMLESGSTATSFEPFTNGASPNPDYPQPINNLSGDVPYKVSGKNSFQSPTTPSFYDKATYNKINDNSLSLSYTQSTSTTYSAYVRIDFDVSKLKPNTEYTISKQNKIEGVSFNNTGALRIRINGVNGNVINGDSLTFTTPSDMNNVGVYFYIAYNNTTTGTSTITFEDIQLEENSTVSDFEPYIEPQTFNIPLGDIELCKIDTYEDKIYSSDGRFYLEKNIDKVVLNGTQPTGFVRNTGTSNWYYVFVNLTQNTPSDNGAYIISSHYKGNAIYNSNTNTGICATTTSKELRIRYGEEDTIANFKNWLSTHNVLVYYVLTTPTTTEITQENYPSLYNALKQIQDYLTAYKINKEFILGYSSPEIEY